MLVLCRLCVFISFPFTVVRKSKLLWAAKNTSLSGCVGAARAGETSLLHRHRKTVQLCVIIYNLPHLKASVSLHTFLAANSNGDRDQLMPRHLAADTSCQRLQIQIAKALCQLMLATVNSQKCSFRPLPNASASADAATT